METGQKLVYGFNDKEHAIECVYTGESKITKDGDILISAKCKGGIIIAPMEMFKRV